MGLDPDKLGIYEGYDHEIETPWYQQCDEDGEPQGFTSAEREEIAAFMMEAWRRFGNLDERG